MSVKSKRNLWARCAGVVLAWAWASSMSTTWAAVATPDADLPASGATTVSGATTFRWAPGILRGPEHAVNASQLLRIVPETATVDAAQICRLHVTLVGPTGVVPAKSSCDTQGLRISPANPLLPAQHYSLFVSVADGVKTALPLNSVGRDGGQSQAVSFAVQPIEAHGRSTVALNGVEEWVPDLSHGYPEWIYANGVQQKAASMRPTPQRAQAHIIDLQAPSGHTAVVGHIERFNGMPLADVKVAIGPVSAHTDAQGRFMLVDVPSGTQSMEVDGSGVWMDGGHYAKHYLEVQAKAQQTTALGSPVYLARIDPGTEVNIASPTDHEVILTHPNLPGLQVRIPKGVVLREQDGSIVTKVSLTPVPIDRAPYPTPTNFSLYFTLQPGGAFVDDPQGRTVQIVYPNYRHLRPATPVDFWNYDADAGWKVYGHGHVSDDGQTIVADAGSSTALGVRQVMTFGYGVSGADPGPGPKYNGGKDGEPVDVYTGIFTAERTDLSIADVIPISITRTYQQMDTRAHEFGPAWSLSYEMSLYQPNSSEVDLVLSDGTRVPFCGSPWTYVSVCSGSAGGYWYGAKLVGNASSGTEQFVVTTRDQTTYVFTGGSPNLLQSITDRNGNTVSLTRDTYGHITQITSPNGRYIQLSYSSNSASGVVTQATDNTGRTVSYQYSNGRLSAVVDADQTILPASQQLTTAYQYDSSGRLWTITDKNGHTALTNVYYAAPDNRIQQQTLADATTWKYAYSGDSTATNCASTPCTQVTNPRGFVTEYDFNANGYVITKIVAQNAAAPFSPQTTRYYLDANNRVSVMLDPLGRSTYIVYDAQGNINQITRLANKSAETVASYFNFDPDYGQLTSYTDELGHTTTYGLDDYGNITSVKNPLGLTWNYAVDDQGLVEQISSPLNNTTTLAYNQADLQSVTDASGHTVSYDSDEVGRTTSVTDAASNSTTFTYDNKDRVSSITDANLGYTSINYDGNGNTKSVLLAGHQNAYSFSWDVRNNYQIMIDPLSRYRWIAAYDGNSNLQSSADGKHQLTNYTFDPFDRPQEVDFKDGSSYKYTFDNGNRLTKIVDSTGDNIAMAWDDYDHLKTVVTNYGSVGYQFDSIGRLRSIQYPSGLKVSYTYDAANQFQTVTIGSDPAMRITPDNDGRLQTVTYPNGATRNNVFIQNHLTALYYADPSSNLLGYWLYNYDSAGRIQTISGTLVKAVTPTAMAATYDDANQVATLNGASLTSDANGNQITDAGLSFTYNAKDQMVGASSGGTTATYATNALGWRDTKTVNGVTTHFIYDMAGHLLAEVDSNKNVLREYIWMGDMPVMLRVYNAGVATEYNIWADHLNTPRVITDQSNNIVWKWDSDLYGNGAPSGTLTFNLRFPGQYFDAETGLHYNGARYYNPKTARYIQSDPLGLKAGWNTYAYADGNSLSRSDQSGKDPMLGVIGAGVGAVWGLVNGAVSGDTGSQLVVDAGSGALAGGLIGLTDGMSAVYGVPIRTIGSAAAEAGREFINGGMRKCALDWKNIGMAGGFNVFGEAAGEFAGIGLGVAESEGIRAVPEADEVAGTFWGGSAAGVLGLPFAAIDRIFPPKKQCCPN